MAKAGARKTRTRRAAKSSDGKLYTLTELGKAAGVSMPTMQRYKKEYQDRIPSQGQGRRQRYPQSAVSVVRKIKEENMKRRGAARRATASGGRRRAAAQASGAAEGYLPLTEIARRAGISYPTARKYAAQRGASIPHRGSGRSRRYSVEAVEAFKKLRSQSRRGRKPAAGRKVSKKMTARRATRPRTVAARDQVLSARVQQLEKAQKDISRQLQDIIDTLRRPLQVTISGS
jgi:DNA-binding transcriptional MerR regulator